MRTIIVSYELVAGSIVVVSEKSDFLLFLRIG